MGKCAKEGNFQVSSFKILQTFWCFFMYIMFMNLVHKLKCEKYLFLLSTYSQIYLLQ